MNRYVRTLLTGTLFLVWVTFLRVASDPFDLVKATILWIGGLLVLGLTWKNLVDSLKQDLNFVLLPGMFFSAAVLSTFFSEAPWVSFFGQYQRYTGLLTLFVCIVFFLVMAKLTSERDVASLMTAVVFASLVSNSYGLLQELDADPFEWSSDSFGKFVFGTLGNPNSASGFTALSAVCATYLLVKEGHSKWRVIGAAVSIGVTGGMLSLYNSFQGTITAAAIATVLLLLQANSESISNLGAKALLALALLILPSADFGVLGVVIGAGIGLIAGVVMTGIETTFKVHRRPRVLFVSSVGIALAVPAFWFADVQNELANGLVERGDFYRSAIRVFREDPVFGSGLETFGFFFTAFRDSSHAVLLEASRTTSVHSVQLGMFSNGGLILGISYLALVAWIMVRLVRRALGADKSDLHETFFWMGAVLAIQLQSSVSVEHIALYPLYFVLYGCALAHSRSAEPSRRTKKLRVQLELLPSIFGTVIAVSLLVVTLRPIRAGMASMDGFEQLVRGDGSSALRSFESATHLAPWEGLYWYQTSELYFQAGNAPKASEYAKVASAKTRYGSGIGAASVRAVLTNGEVEEARALALRYLASDPYAPQLRSSLVGLFDEVARAFESQGDSEMAERSSSIARELRTA